MAGHNKWSKIKNRKAVTDKQKSALFARISKLIQVEAKKNIGDTFSAGLKQAIEKAREANMPKENIERLIAKASDAKDLIPVLFECYGPGGVGMIITALTDNNNRTNTEIKHLLSQYEIKLGVPGSVSWNFYYNTNEQTWDPQTFISLEEKDVLVLDQIIETLSEHDDVQDIFTNNDAYDLS